MGKRELLLIGGFVLLGTIVYYATGPAAAPGERGLRVSKLLEEVRRDLHGNPGSAEVSSSTVLPIREGVTELRIEIGGAPLTIVGEDREDIAGDLSVRSNGFDDAEATRLAQETKVTVKDAGTALLLGIDYPEPGVQRANLSIKVPKDLTVRVQPSRGKLEISDVSSVEVIEARGQVTVRRVSERLVITHRGGKLEIEDVADLKLNTRGSSIVMRGVKGEAALQIQAGELRASGLSGPIEIESNNSRIAIEELASQSASGKPARRTV